MFYITYQINKKKKNKNNVLFKVHWMIEAKLLYAQLSVNKN